MKTIGNIIWVIFGGLQIAIEYFLSGLALMLIIIGISTLFTDERKEAEGGLI